MMSETQGTDAAKTELMGHTDISMTNYYTNAELAALKKVTDQLAQKQKEQKSYANAT